MKKGKWKPTFSFRNQWKENDDIINIDFVSFGYIAYYLFPFHQKEIYFGILGLQIYIGIKLIIPRTARYHTYIPSEFFKELK